MLSSITGKSFSIDSFNSDISESETPFDFKVFDNDSKSPFKFILDTFCTFSFPTTMVVLSPKIALLNKLPVSTILICAFASSSFSSLLEAYDEEKKNFRGTRALLLTLYM